MSQMLQSVVRQLVLLASLARQLQTILDIQDGVEVPQRHLISRCALDRASCLNNPSTSRVARTAQTQQPWQSLKQVITAFLNLQISEAHK